MSTPSSCDNPHASGGRYPECPPDAHAQPSELPCDPARTYPGRGLVLLWFQTVGRTSAHNEMPAQGGSAFSPAGFLPFAVFTTSGLSAAFATSGPSAAFSTYGPSVGLFWRLRLGASALRRNAARFICAWYSRTRASSRVPEYLQSRIALKQRAVENGHSQRF